MLNTFKYRRYPTAAQERQMFQVLNVCRHWYNMCLAERKWSYELEGRSVSKSEQERTGVHYRKAFPQAQIVFISSSSSAIATRVWSAYVSSSRSLVQSCAVAQNRCVCRMFSAASQEV